MMMTMMRSMMMEKITLTMVSALTLNDRSIEYFQTLFFDQESCRFSNHYNLPHFSFCSQTKKNETTFATGEMIPVPVKRSRALLALKE